MPLFPPGLKFGGEKYIMFVCYLSVYESECEDFHNIVSYFAECSYTMMFNLIDTHTYTLSNMYPRRIF